MYQLDELLTLLERKIKTLELPKTPKLLYDPISYTLNASGKRIRPLMLLLAANMYDDRIDEALNAALAIEIFHNFTLLHDDIMDNAPVRRGRPSVYARWNSNVAILSGDAMTILAYRQLAECRPDKLAVLLEEFNKLAIGVCEGQQYDMDYETRDDVSINDYIGMITLKTSVLIAGALKMGAIIGNAPRTDCDRLYEFGIRLGIAFQIQDDMLDLYGNQNFGKPIGGDIVSGKKSFLHLKAMEKADADGRHRLTELIRDSALPDREKIAKMRALYDNYDVKTEAAVSINRYFREAMEILETVDLPDHRKTEMKALSLQLLNRDK